jgi:hypothetical protein
MERIMEDLRTSLEAEGDSPYVQTKLEAQHELEST